MEFRFSPGAVPPVSMVRSPRARRYIARLLHDGSLRITIPRGGSRAEAVRFAQRLGPWAEKHRSRLAQQRRPDHWPTATREWLARARRELPRRVAALAQRHGLCVRRVSIRRQRSRWGSCSHRGTISLNWRLVHAPDFVRDYVIVHELMHLRELNHSPRFWALVEAACPGHRAAEQWLKAHGRWLQPQT